MKTIWKFPFQVTDEFGIDMPIGAKVLSVQVQVDVPTLWAIVDDQAIYEKRMFSLRGTGQALGDVGDYIDTFQLYGDRLVFHLFEAVS